MNKIIGTITIALLAASTVSAAITGMCDGNTDGSKQDCSSGTTIGSTNYANYKQNKGSSHTGTSTALCCEEPTEGELATTAEYGPTLKKDYEITAKAYKEYIPIAVGDVLLVDLAVDGVAVPITRGCVHNSLSYTLRDFNGKTSCGKILSTFPSGGEMTQVVAAASRIGTAPNYNGLTGGALADYTDALGCGCLVSYTYAAAPEGVIGCPASQNWFNAVRDNLVGTVAAAVSAKSESINENVDLHQLQVDANRAISDANQVADLCTELKQSIQIKRNTYHAYNSAFSDMTMFSHSVPSLKGTRTRTQEIPQEKILAHALGQGHETEVLMKLLTLA